MAVVAVVAALLGGADHACRTDCLTRQEMRAVVRPWVPWLDRVAWCETRNRNAATGNGYWGFFQFDLATWRSVGGTGYPHQHGWLVQAYRAVKLRKLRGTAPWPVCG